MSLSINQQIHLPLLIQKEVELYLKREDLLHPMISGNKFRKLKYNLTQARKEKKEYIITFGGAFSNHVLATAAAGKEYGFKTIGIIRGEELGVDLQKTLANNDTLRQAQQLGMQFDFVSRQVYQQKNKTPFLNVLQGKYPNGYIIPEGGTNELAIKGCEEILSKQDEEMSHVICAMGTGGTVTGIVNSSLAHQQVLVFPALKGNWINDEIKSLKPNKYNWQVFNNYHFRGYGKVSDELISFVNNFKKETGVLLDPIYTGKMMFGLMDLIKNDFFQKNSKILAIHTGGLQGIKGVNKQLKQKNKPIIIE